MPEIRWGFRGVNSLRKYNSAVFTVAGFTASKAVPGAALLIATPLWIKLHGPNEYLAYSLIWAVSLIATGLSTRWLTSAILRFTGDDTRTVASIPLTARLLNVAVSGVIAGLGGYGVISLQSAEVESSILVVAAGALLGAATASYLVLQSTAQRALSSTALAVSEFIRNVGAVIVSLVVSILWPIGGALTILGSFVISTVAGGLYLALVRRSDGQGPSTNSSWSVAGEFWRYGWPMAGWAALSTLSVYVDRLVVAAFDDGKLPGAYAGVADIAIRSFSLLAFPATMYFHPKLMMMWNAENREGIESVLRRTAGWFGVYCMIVAVLGGLVTSFAYRSVFPELELPTPVFILLFISAGLWQIALIAHKPLEMTDQTKWMLVVLAFSLSIAIVVSITSYHAFGVSGAPVGLAVGALIYSSATFSLGTHFIRKATNEN